MEPKNLATEWEPSEEGRLTLSLRVERREEEVAVAAVVLLLPALLEPPDEVEGGGGESEPVDPVE